MANILNNKKQYRNCDFCGQPFDSDADKKIIYFLLFGWEGKKRWDYCCINHYEIHREKEWSQVWRKGLFNPKRWIAIFLVVFFLFVAGVISNATRNTDTNNRESGKSSEYSTETVEHSNKRNYKSDRILSHNDENAPAEANTLNDNSNNESKSEASEQSTSKIKEIAAQYFELGNSRNYDEIRQLYADNLERFYLMHDISRDSVIQESRGYNEKNPQSTFSIESISTAPDNKSEATVIGKSCQNESKCNQVKVIIKTNEAGKIKYVRALKI